MTTSPFDGHNSLSTLPLILVETPPPLACLHCAAGDFWKVANG